MTKEFETTLVARTVVIRQDDGAVTDAVEANAGQWFPVVRIKDEVFESTAIQSFRYMVGDTLLPFLSLTIDDYSKKFSDSQFPEVDDLVTLRISNNADTAHIPVKVDLMILDVFGADKSMTFTAVNFIPKLHERNNKSFDGAITDVLRDVAKECGLGYVSNFQSSNDTGTWICRENYYEFIQYLEERMFIAEDDCVKIYIDQYNNLNVVSLKTAKLDRTLYELLTDPTTGEPFEETKNVEFTNNDYNDDLSKKLILEGWTPLTNYGTTYLSSKQTASYTTKIDEKHLESANESYDSASDNALENTASTYFSNRVSAETVFQKVLTSRNKNRRLKNIILQGTYIEGNLKYYVPDVFAFMHVPVEIFETPKTQMIRDQEEGNTNFTLPDKLDGKPSNDYLPNEIFTGDYCIMHMSYIYTKSKNSGKIKQNVSMLKQ